MFSEIEQTKEEGKEKPNTNTKPKNEYIPMTFEETQIQNSMKMSSLDNLLELEKQHNKREHWNKLDKTQKTQILHAFSENYGRENALPMKEVKTLKLFFNECLEKGKLNKTKDVVYNRETCSLESIPSLFYNIEKKHFILKNVEGKRVSTLKSLTPKRTLSE
tara:strand:+ start:1074 stop:1559 length:486 start_codon:yes stop_codon:yes gene_type:complete